jgi:hypothetical protein
VDFAIVQQPAETNASHRISGKPTLHQRRVVAHPGLAGGDTVYYFRGVHMPGLSVRRLPLLQLQTLWW